MTIVWPAFLLEILVTCHHLKPWTLLSIIWPQLVQMFCLAWITCGWEPYDNPGLHGLSGLGRLAKVNCSFHFPGIGISQWNVSLVLFSSSECLCPDMRQIASGSRHQVSGICFCIDCAVSWARWPGVDYHNELLLHDLDSKGFLFQYPLSLPPPSITKHIEFCPVFFYLCLSGRSIKSRSWKFNGWRCISSDIFVFGVQTIVVVSGDLWLAQRFVFLAHLSVLGQKVSALQGL